MHKFIIYLQKGPNMSGDIQDLWSPPTLDKKAQTVGCFISILTMARALTVNPRIIPLGAYLFLMLFGWGLIRGGAYKII